MLGLFRSFFSRLISIYTGLFAPSYFGVLRAGYILGGSFLFLILLSWLGITNKVVPSMVASICIMILVLGMFSQSEVWLPRFLIGPSKIPIGIISKFTHRSYIFCMIYFSTYISLFFYLPLSLIGIASNGSFFEIYFFVCGANTILWFMYHLLYRTASANQIKSRVALYAAISATLSLLLVDRTTTVLTFIGVGYLWIQYFTELYITEMG